MAQFLDHRLDVVLGDITTLAVDAIVNAANESLLGGGGVDGAIHRVAGPQLLAACRPLNGAKPGEAKLTPGFELPARFVVHTVGPRWKGGERGEPATLRAAYRNSLHVAVAHGSRTIAFPAISTGSFGYPLEAATRIALWESVIGLAQFPKLERIVLCCFRAKDHSEYVRIATDDMMLS